MTSFTAPSAIRANWRVARFDELLERVERKIVLDESREYTTVGVRWYGEGAFCREHLLGMDISRKQQWVIREGDIVYNKLFAWKGSFAVAASDVDGHIVSDKFPTYRADPEIVDLGWLRCYFRTNHIARQAELLSKGAAAISKLTLNPPQFWDLTIPLPPLDEQRRIVVRIEELASKIEEARELRREADEAAEALVTSYLSEAVGVMPAKGHLAQILADKPRNGWSARCDNAADGVPVLSLSAATGFNYRRDQFKRTSEETFPNAHYWLRPGDLLMTRSNTPELVGHAAVYDGHPAPCIYPDLMMRLVVDETKADKDFVHVWLQSRQVREYIGRVARGTNPSMKKISQRDVMSIPFPIGLSLSEQRHVRDDVKRMKERALDAIQLQLSVCGALEALVPAVLDRAFSGEL